MAEQVINPKVTTIDVNQLGVKNSITSETKADVDTTRDSAVSGSIAQRPLGDKEATTSHSCAFHDTQAAIVVKIFYFLMLPTREKHVRHPPDLKSDRSHQAATG